ncbi:hypothetical protein SteCoe_32164 [Stentor coeruleus]|uniref:Uncharacterized protein n=1 Tax=Stentor coeruleus TaxID=5963 RepID=A0A1R2AZQ3_9CILI|nr:hypothetical protein SteCoe_32164 [Stentor coeruleus]
MDIQVIKKLVSKHKFNFKLVAEELKITEDQARKQWTYIYCCEKNKPLPSSVEKDLKKDKVKYQQKLSIEEIRASDLLITNRKKVDFLDHSDIDFTKQKTFSITGEEITPSGYCVLKHSLKDTFHQMRERVLEFLPDIDAVDDEIDENDQFMDFKVGMQGDQAVFQIKNRGEDWRPESPTVPLPNFDDIQVVPEEDRPKPKLSSYDN